MYSNKGPGSSVYLKAGPEQERMSDSQMVVRTGGGADGLARLAGSQAWPPAVPSAEPPAAEVVWQTLRKAISFPALMVVLLVGISLVSLRLRLPDPDTFWHVAVGERIWATHVWPTADSYSFTAPGVHWIAYEWLGEVAMALAARAGELSGLAAMLIGLIAVITVLLYYYVFLRCGNTKAAFLATALLLPVAAVSFTLRPQLLGYIFLLLTLVCLERFRQGRPKSLWCLPFLFLIWVNTHGTFVLGLAAIGLYWVSGFVNFERGGLVGKRWTDSQRLQLSVTFLFCTLALLVTPYGSRLAAYPLEIATSQPINIANVQEWQPLSFSLGLGKYLLALLLVVFVAHVIFPLKHRLDEMGMLLFAVYAICVHIRFVSVFVMLFAPILANILVRWVPPYERAKDKYILNVALIALTVAALIKYLPGNAELHKMVAKDYPVGAVEYLRQHPQPTGMFNDYGYGGYLIWQLGPEHKVFIDGRADLYEYSGVFGDYMKIVNLDAQALPLLRKYGIESCLVGRADAIATLLAAAPDWERVYADDLSAIFILKRGVNASQTN
jgi:hypothetical protein